MSLTDNRVLTLSVFTQKLEYSKSPKTQLNNIIIKLKNQKYVDCT